MNRREWEALRASRHGKSKATEKEKNLYYRRPKWESVKLRIHRMSKRAKERFI